MSNRTTRLACKMRTTLTTHALKASPRIFPRILHMYGTETSVPGHTQTRSELGSIQSVLAGGRRSTAFNTTGASPWLIAGRIVVRDPEKSLVFQKPRLAGVFLRPS